MAYSSTNPPGLLMGALGNKVPNLWGYRSTDAINTVAGAAYFTDGLKLGIKTGDFMLVSDQSSSTGLGSVGIVTTVSTSGATLRATLTATS